MQTAGTGEDIWDSSKGQRVAGGRKSGWIRKGEFWKQIKGVEWDGTTHMELWEDANTIDGPSAPYMTKEMTRKAPPSYCHPPLPPSNPKMVH